jgi:sulfatase modifying factor 1
MRRITPFVSSCLCALALATTLCAQTPARPGPTYDGKDVQVVRRGAEPAPRLGARIALVVGIDRYEHLPELGYAEKDAKDVEQALAAVDFTVTSMRRDTRLSPARAESILAEISALCTAADPQDTLLVFLSGHGFSEPGGAPFFCAQFTDPANLAVTGLSLQEVKRRLEASKAGQKMLVVDACRNVPSRSAADRGLELPDFRADSLAILFSTAPGSRSWEPRGRELDRLQRPIENGIFTHYLLRGLAGEADGVFAESRDGWLTFRELAYYVGKEVKSQTRLQQKPYLDWVGEAGGDILMRRVAVVEPVVVPAVPPPSDPVVQPPAKPESTATGPGLEWSMAKSEPMVLGQCWDGLVEAATLKGYAEDPGVSDRGLGLWQSRWRPRLLANRHPGRTRVRIEIDLDKGSYSHGWPFRFVCEQQTVKDMRRASDPREEDWSSDGQDAELETILGEFLVRRNIVRDPPHRKPLTAASVPSKPEPVAARDVSSWAKVLRVDPDPSVVTDAEARSKIVASGWPWRVEDKASGIVLLLVPAGEFVMGSPESEGYRSNSEIYRRDSGERQHRRRITKPFYLGETEVAQYSWQKVMGNNPSQFEDPRNPVEEVSWDDIQSFLQKTGLSLPSEAQWEYACRAGTTTAFSFGQRLSSAQANYDGNYPYGSGHKGEFRQRTTAVGSLGKNPWGFSDMHGNVWEWCADSYQQHYPDDGATEWPAGAGPSRVLRGGSWADHAVYCRAAQRNNDQPSRRSGFLGFRAARTL